MTKRLIFINVQLPNRKYADNFGKETDYREMRGMGQVDRPSWEHRIETINRRNTTQRD